MTTSRGKSSSVKSLNARSAAEDAERDVRSHSSDPVYPATTSSEDGDYDQGVLHRPAQAIAGLKEGTRSVLSQMRRFAVARPHAFVGIVAGALALCAATRAATRR